MAGDIEEFLKRAAERRKQQGRGASPPPPSQQRPAMPSNRPARLNDVIDAEIIDVEAVSGDDVSYSVARHLDNREFSQRTSQLGEAVRNEAQNLENNIQRDLGQRPDPLKERPGAATPTGKTTDIAAVVTANPVHALAAQLLATMSDPQALRHAIVLSEIFNRPEHRW